MIISRYLTREIVNTLLAVTIVLLLAFLSQQTVRYLGYVATGRIPTSVLLELVSFEIPFLLAILLPLGLYLGILLAFGRLYADNEMSIMQMYGFGKKRLMVLVLMLAAVVAGLVLYLMLWINPSISAKRQQVMSADRNTVSLVQTLIPGRFQTTPDGTHVMYVEKLSRDHQRAENVFLAQEKKSTEDSDRNAWMLVFAKEGYQTQNKQTKEQYFVTADGYRYEGKPGQNNYKIIQYKKYTLRVPQADVRVAHIEAETLPTSTLWRDYYKDPKRAAELQWRFSLGLTALILALLAVPLSHVRPRHGRYLLLFPAIIIYIVYVNLLFIARRWLEVGFLPISIGMWWVHGVFLIFIILAMKNNIKSWK